MGLVRLPLILILFSKRGTKFRLFSPGAPIFLSAISMITYTFYSFFITNSPTHRNGTYCIFLSCLFLYAPSRDLIQTQLLGNDTS